MRLCGYASTAARDSKNCIVMPGAFDLAIKARGIDGIRLLLDHSPALIAGRILSLDPRPDGLWVEAELDPKRPHCAARIRDIWRAGGHGFSIGGRARRFGKGADGSLIVHTIDLDEISLTSFPINCECRASIMAAPARPDEMQAIFADQAAACAGRQIKLPPLEIRYHTQGEAN